MRHELRNRILKFAVFLLLLLVAKYSTLQLRGQSAAPVTLVKAARLLDPRTGNVLAPAAVLIEGTRSSRLENSPRTAIPAGAKIIDLGPATLLPGLIDGHTHLFLDIIVPPEAEQAASVQRTVCSGDAAGHRRIAEQARSNGRAVGARGSGERYHDRS